MDAVFDKDGKISDFDETQIKNLAERIHSSMLKDVKANNEDRVNYPTSAGMPISIYNGKEIIFTSHTIDASRKERYINDFSSWLSPRKMTIRVNRKNGQAFDFIAFSGYLFGGSESYDEETLDMVDLDEGKVYQIYKSGYYSR